MTVLTWVILFGFTADPCGCCLSKGVSHSFSSKDRFSDITQCCGTKKKKAFAHAEFCSSDKLSSEML